jgi:hypothetical protein
MHIMHPFKGGCKMKTLKKCAKILIGVAILSLAILYPGCEERETELDIESSEAERIIRINTEDDIIYYEETVFWDERGFLEILEDKSAFYDSQVGEFKETYEVDAGDFNVEFTENKNSTTISCEVYEKFNGNWYDFHWLLNPMGLDFLDSPFEKYEKGLSWEGVIEGNPTTITLDFSFPIENCHAHVWQK